MTTKCLMVYASHPKYGFKKIGLPVKIHEWESHARNILMKDGWELVDNDGLVLEVERVYATRWDCIGGPERVRLAA